MVLYLILFCALTATALGFYTVFIEPFRLRVTEWALQTDKLRHGQTLRIALVADPHMAWPWMTIERLKTVADKTNDLDADIILLLGDYVGTHPFKRAITPADAAPAFKHFKARDGVYAIFGNHDFDNRAPGWDAAMKATGIPFLENRALKIRAGGIDLWLAGLEDQQFQNPDIRATLAQVTDDAPVVMMMHEPDLFPEIPVSVMLSVAGHTHGGQISPPGIGPLIVPSRFGTKYAYGHIQENGKNLIVSGGLGVSILPVRFGCPPEIVLVTLSGTKAD